MTDSAREDALARSARIHSEMAESTRRREELIRSREEHERITTSSRGPGVSTVAALTSAPAFAARALDTITSFFSGSDEEAGRAAGIQDVARQQAQTPRPAARDAQSTYNAAQSRPAVPGAAGDMDAAGSGGGAV